MQLCKKSLILSGLIVNPAQVVSQMITKIITTESWCYFWYIIAYCWKDTCWERLIWALGLTKPKNVPQWGEPASISAFINHKFYQMIQNLPWICKEIFEIMMEKEKPKISNSRNEKKKKINNLFCFCFYLASWIATQSWPQTWADQFPAGQGSPCYSMSLWD